MTGLASLLKEESLTTEEVNEMVAESFGRRFGKDFRGDYWEHNGDITEGMVSIDSKPNLIAHSGFGVYQTFNVIAGHFGEKRGNAEDCSVIRVLPKYAKQAIRYAQLYEQRTGKRVSIRFWE